MKRGSRKPEKASTRPPAEARSSFPQRDRRPPRRGKSGSPPATGAAKAKAPTSGAPTGTSQSGKPIKQALNPSTVASTETRPKKASRKSKGKVETPANPMERRTLTPAEQGHMALRAARLSVEARRRERKLKRETKAERDEIKLLRAQAEALEDQAEQGYELVPEGDLFADRAEFEAGASTPSVPPKAADKLLREVASHAAKGNGLDFDANEPAPKIDNAKAGPTRIEASRAEDDITRAANADAAGAHA